MVGSIILAVILLLAIWGFCWWGNRIMDKITHLERENLTLAKALKAHTERLDSLEKDTKHNLEMIAFYGNKLPAEPDKPKIVAKPPAPKRVNWGQARAALERASEPQEES